jgi:Protein of unknown function (DUF3455)
MKKLILLAVFVITMATFAMAQKPNGLEPDLPEGCEDLQPSVANQAVSRVFAAGVQVYVWNGSAWTFVAPVATLYPNDNSPAEFGIHCVGPTWRSKSGSLVVGKNPVRCTPDANSIPWLLLEADRTEGAGIFANVTYIQRVNTSGGKAPSVPGSFLGEEARVLYTTDYVFYKATAR